MPSKRHLKCTLSTNSSEPLKCIFAPAALPLHKVRIQCHLLHDFPIFANNRVAERQDQIDETFATNFDGVGLQFACNFGAFNLDCASLQLSCDFDVFVDSSAFAARVNDFKICNRSQQAASNLLYMTAIKPTEMNQAWKP